MSGVYHGFTYPKNKRSDKALRRWRLKRCQKGQHLWDECLTLDRHTLHCDACGLQVHIGHVDATYQDLG
jgi:hypothetical protein